MIDRILQLMKQKDLTASQFADEIGIQRSGISHLLSGRNKPSLDFVVKVLNRYPDVSADFLLFGRAPAESGSEQIQFPAEREIVKEAPTLFDSPVVPEQKKETRPIRQVSKEKTDRKIEKIVVFYDDRTFREYEPD